MNNTTPVKTQPGYPQPMATATNPGTAATAASTTAALLQQQQKMQASNLSKTHLGMQQMQYTQAQLLQQQQLQQQQQQQQLAAAAAAAAGGAGMVGTAGMIPPTMIPEETEVISRKKLQELVGQISTGEVLDPDVEEVLLEVVDDFIDSVTTFACSLAKHRNSSTLEVRDIMCHLERNWNIKIPGYGNAENPRPFKRSVGTESHRTRLALVKKSMGPPTKQQKLQ